MNGSPRRLARLRALLAAVALGAAALGGCGGDEPARGAASDAEVGAGSTATARAASARAGGTALRRAICPPGLAGCRVASGRVLYVERVDPDGDGDAHLVVASASDVTAPGVTVVDVAARLRPKPLPRRGDRISAAGPVYRGSFGHRQIEAVELFVARR